MKKNVIIKWQHQTAKNAEALIKIKRQVGGSSGINFWYPVNTQVSICSQLTVPLLVSTEPGKHQELLIAGAFGGCQTIRLYSTEQNLTIL